MIRKAWRKPLTRGLIVAATIGMTWGVLLVGQEEPPPIVQPGEVSPHQFVATQSLDVLDEAETERERAAAEAAVEDVYERNLTRVEEVRQAVTALFAAVVAGVEPAPGVIPPPPTTTTSTTSTTVPETTSSTIGTGEGGEDPIPITTTTVVVEPAEIRGFLFIDVDQNALFDAELGDAPLVDVDVVLGLSDGTDRRVRTNSEGVFIVTDVPPGPVVPFVDHESGRFPALLTLSTGEPAEVEAAQAETVTIDAIGFMVVTELLESQRDALARRYPLLDSATIATLVGLATEDVTRAAMREASYLDQLEVETIQRSEEIMGQEIRGVAELEALQIQLKTVPRTVFFSDGTPDPAAGVALSDIVANNIQVNMVLNQQTTQAAKDAARNAVEPVTVPFVPGQVIVEEGDVVTKVQFDALEEMGLLESPSSAGPLPMLLVVAVTVVLLSFYLARFRPRFWSVLRWVALFGLLIVIAALTSRVVAILIPETAPAVGFLIPAAMIGMTAAILFDARIGVLISVAVGGMTALATNDVGYAMFAGLATMVPIPFVSSISSRGDIRRAVIYSAFALAVIAVPIAWLFHGGEDPWTVVWQSAGLAFANGLVMGLVGVAALSFLEIIFDVTTTLRLLDLTDRNHPALQLLEEKARGTFNHSLMVGTLADGAARAIGGNNLLARAAAYYHDLGKTENPSFFIENQFGGFNPHDQLPPEESAQIIRQHVIDGVRMAGEFNIPESVAEGVSAHHGDAIMRYFYHRAIERYGADNVDLADYRHEGHKPESRELAILMLADSVEGACRAVFGEKDPSPDAITEVVDRVVDEKMTDGQLSLSSLTMGELTKVKQAFIDALIGTYHQRIPYPEFPQIGQSAPAASDVHKDETKGLPQPEPLEEGEAQDQGADDETEAIGAKPSTDV